MKDREQVGREREREEGVREGKGKAVREVRENVAERKGSGEEDLRERQRRRLAGR